MERMESAIIQREPKVVISALRRCVLNAERSIHRIRLSDMRLSLLVPTRHPTENGIPNGVLNLSNNSSDKVHGISAKFDFTSPNDCNDSQHLFTAPVTGSSLRSDVLQTDAFICPGSHDIRGRNVIFVNCQHSVWTEDNLSQLAQVLLYYCSVCFLFHEVTCYSSISLLVDTLAASPQAVTTFMHTLSLVQSVTGSTFGAVFVLADTSVFPAALFQSVTNLKIVSNKEDLNLFIDPKSSLPRHGGLLTYSHEEWVSFQLSLEKFVGECFDAAHKLAAVSSTLASGHTLPSSAEECLCAVKLHRHSVDEVLNELSASELLTNGMDTSLKQHPLSANSCYCCDVEELHKQIVEASQRLKKAADLKHSHLEQCLQLRQFETKAALVNSWMNSEGEMAVKQLLTSSCDLAVVISQQSDLEQFLLTVEIQRNKMADIASEADKLLLNFKCSDVCGVHKLCDDLKSRFDVFVSRVNSTKHIVTLRLECCQILDKIKQWSFEPSSELKSDGGGDVTLNEPSSSFSRLNDILQDLEDDALTEYSSKVHESYKHLIELHQKQAHGSTGVKPVSDELCTQLQLETVAINSSHSTTCHSSVPVCHVLPVRSPAFDVREYFLNGSSSTESDVINVCESSECDVITVDCLESSLPVKCNIVPVSTESTKSPAVTCRQTSADLQSSQTKSQDHSRWNFLKKTLSLLTDGGSLENHGRRCRRVSSSSIESLPSHCNIRASLTSVDSWQPLEGSSQCKYGWLPMSQHAVDTEQDSCAESEVVDEEVMRCRTVSLIMQELLQTERDYVDALQYVIVNYIPEINSNCVPQPLRGKKNVVFGNLEKIHQFHAYYFVQKIEQCMSSPFELGTCFLDHEPEFYLYSLYSKNKPRSDELMTECGSQYFMTKQKELGDYMNLSSYLLKPIQRLGKYALLLKQIAKECPLHHPSHSDILGALEMVQFQLRHGNDLLAMDGLRKCDMNLQEQGMLLRQDDFVVCHRRKKCLRRVFLFEELIILSKTRHNISGHDTYVYKDSIKTSDVGLTETVGESGDTFELWFRKRLPGSTYTLRAKSERLRHDWVADISCLLWKQALHGREKHQSQMLSKQDVAVPQWNTAQWTSSADDNNRPSSMILYRSCSSSTVDTSPLTTHLCDSVEGGAVMSKAEDACTQTTLKRPTKCLSATTEASDDC